MFAYSSLQNKFKGKCFSIKFSTSISNIIFFFSSFKLISSKFFPISIFVKSQAFAACEKKIRNVI
jgi:hypothetical protein